MRVPFKSIAREVSSNAVPRPTLRSLIEVYVRVPRATLDIFAAVIAVAETKTLDKAAEVLGLSTASAVHKRIRAASTLLEVELFTNANDGLVLTEEGQTLYDDARRVVAQALLAEEKVIALRKLKARRLLIGHSTYLPPKLLAAVLKMEFGTEAGPVQVEHIPGFTQNIIRDVAEGTLHAGFGYLPIQGPELIARVLFEEPLAVAIPIRHPLAVKPYIRPQEIANEPVIAVARHTLPWMHTEIADFFAGFGVDLKIIADAFGPPEALTLVENRIGICLLGGSAVAHAGVVAKPLEPRVLTRKCGLFLREDSRHPTVQAFVEFTIETMGMKPKPL